MRQRPLKRTRLKKALPALFCAGIAVLLPLLTGCKKETPKVTEPTTAVTTTENTAQTFARQRVEDSIQTALELVKKNPCGRLVLHGQLRIQTGQCRLCRAKRRPTGTL